MICESHQTAEMLQFPITDTPISDRPFPPFVTDCACKLRGVSTRVLARPTHNRHAQVTLLTDNSCYKYTDSAKKRTAVVIGHRYARLRRIDGRARRIVRTVHVTCHGTHHCLHRARSDTLR